jgi:5-methylcytosine-specific restriction enzyme A
VLKSCSWCGSIHDNKYVCDKKPTNKRTKDKITKEDRFRWTGSWQKKRKYIREDRDKHMCQICIRELYNTQKKYNYEDISVHHIVPLVEDYSKRLDDDCLISLCRYHHEMAEDERISRRELIEIVREQEEKLLN